MRKFIRLLLGLAACGVLAFGGVNLAFYIQESNQSISLNENLIDHAVVIRNSAPQSAAPASDAEQEIQPAETGPHETAPIEVDFEVLAETNKDIVGWLYCEDTPINLPVVQAADNAYYLDRMFDRTGNGSGTLFVDFRNAGDFSDNNTIIYGHNMKNKKMFGTLPDYKKQEFFDEHPVMWLLTPSADYKIELVAGIVTPMLSDVYAFDLPDEDVLATVRQAMADSTFTSDVEVELGDRFVTLSTCSYEFENARYVLIGRLTALR